MQTNGIKADQWLSEGDAAGGRDYIRSKGIFWKYLDSVCGS